MTIAIKTSGTWFSRLLAHRWLLVSGVLVVAFVALAGWGKSNARAGMQRALARTAGHGLAMTVYKSPSCECCGRWIAQLRDQGFTVTVVDLADVASVKTRLGVPGGAASCHTAMIDGYVVEGHVPTEDILRLLKERPAVIGIAVPGMPTGAPGMDGPKVPFTVVSFDNGGTLTTFAKH